jgi:alpha-galactosidase
MSYIDRDKISLPELVGHLRDHREVKEGSLLHWLFPRKELENGLRALVDDKACQCMCDCIDDAGVADVFVEDVPTQRECDDEDMQEANVSDFEDELIDMDAGRAASKDVEEVPANSHVMKSIRSESREEVERQIRHLKEFYSSPSKKGKKYVKLVASQLKRTSMTHLILLQRTVIICQGMLVPLKKMKKLLKY